MHRATNPPAFNPRRNGMLLVLHGAPSRASSQRAARKIFLEDLSRFELSCQVPEGGKQLRASYLDFERQGIGSKMTTAGHFRA